MWVVGLDQLLFQVVDQHLFSELVACSNVNEGWYLVELARFYDLDCVILFAFNLWVVEEQLESLLAPVWGLTGVADWRKSRNRLELASL